MLPSFIFEENQDFIEEEDNPAKVIVAKEDLDCVDSIKNVQMIYLD